MLGRTAGREKGMAQRRPHPVTIRGVQGAVAVTTGSGHACALGARGEVWCWGQNESGQFGDGSTNSRGWEGDWAATARPVAGLGKAIAVSAGVGRTCAVVEGGAIWCWGDATDTPWRQ